MTASQNPPDHGGALKCSGCRSAVPSPGLCGACRAKRAALRALSEEETAKRRAKWSRTEQTRRDKVAVFAKLDPELASRLLAEVRAERAARKAAQ